MQYVIVGLARYCSLGFWLILHQLTYQVIFLRKMRCEFDDALKTILSLTHTNTHIMLQPLHCQLGNWLWSAHLLILELEIETPKNHENEDLGRAIATQEACNWIVEVVQEAVKKMEIVFEEKSCMLKRARLAVEACDHELQDKASKVAEFKIDRQRKKQQVDELESIVRLKQAEAEMFQIKASVAKQEAETLQGIALAKSDKAEQDYASMYLKRRLDEAEAEKQCLFEKIKLQEDQLPVLGCSGGSDPAQMLSKIQDLLKNVYNVTPKAEEQHTRGHLSHGSTP